jgi:hypothetical protein
MADTLTMAGIYTEDELTPFTFEEAAAAMKWALAEELNTSEDKVPLNSLALALAKTALETGRWKHIHKYNWGNIKASAKYEGMYTCFGCDEIIKGQRVWFDPDTAYDPQDPLGMPNAKFAKPSVPPGNPQTRFRAYANLYDGAQQYCAFVHGGRYKLAWAELLKGNVQGYIHQLKLAGYFTADEAVYLKGVSGIFNEFMGKLKGLPGPETEIDWDAIRKEARVLLYTYSDLQSQLKLDAAQATPNT